MKYKGKKVKIEIGCYNNGRVAISLVDEKKGEDYAVCTVNVPEISLISEQNVLIKSYSENNGMSGWLMENGIIGPVLREHRAGWVTVTEHQLLKTSTIVDKI